MEAIVSGSSLYEVQITIQPLADPDWKRIQAECSGRVGSLLDLLGGQLGKGVMEVICDRDKGIFPAPKEIRMSCSCPDWADMCKHVAATMYGVGVRFDADPALFFKLRGVDPLDLLSTSAQEVLTGLSQGSNELAGEDLESLFGIDLDVGTPAPNEEPELQAPTKKIKASDQICGPQRERQKTFSRWLKNDWKNSSENKQIRIPTHPEGEDSAVTKASRLVRALRGRLGEGLARQCRRIQSRRVFTHPLDGGSAVLGSLTKDVIGQYQHRHGLHHRYGSWEDARVVSAPGLELHRFSLR